MTTARRVRLLVCGNVDRCDDGAAILAATHLIPGQGVDEVPGVEVVRCGQLDIDELLESAGEPTVIVDTAVGIEPGRVVTLTFDELEFRRHRATPHSSHALPIDQVIGVAREVSDKPVDGLFVGIGAADLGFGRSLSEPVREAMGDYVMAIQAALLALASDQPAAGGGG
jgi:hydrogenase maturation protease